jgi:hypothetical protein
MRRHSTGLRVGIVLVVLALGASACSSGDEGATASARSEENVTVLPNRLANEVVVNVTFTDAGFEPATVFVPAGIPVRLALRNRTEHEHHYRVAGLLASDVRYFSFPAVSTDELEGLPPEEIAEIDPVLVGITDEAEAEHILHHLLPTTELSKAPSAHGIKPLPGEVHGYTERGQFDILNFIPLRTGRYVVEDVLNPEITGTFVVFLPEDAVLAG